MDSAASYPGSATDRPAGQKTTDDRVSLRAVKVVRVILMLALCGPSGVSTIQRKSPTFLDCFPQEIDVALGESSAQLYDSAESVNVAWNSFFGVLDATKGSTCGNRRSPMVVVVVESQLSGPRAESAGQIPEKASGQASSPLPLAMAKFTSFLASRVTDPKAAPVLVCGTPFDAQPSHSNSGPRYADSPRSSSQLLNVTDIRGIQKAITKMGTRPKVLRLRWTAECFKPFADRHTGELIPKYWLNPLIELWEKPLDPHLRKMYSNVAYIVELDASVFGSDQLQANAVLKTGFPSAFRRLFEEASGGSREGGTAESVLKRIQNVVWIRRHENDADTHTADSDCFTFVVDESTGSWWGALTTPLADSVEWSSALFVTVALVACILLHFTLGRLALPKVGDTKLNGSCSGRESTSHLPAGIAGSAEPGPKALTSAVADNSGDVGESGNGNSDTSIPTPLGQPAGCKAGSMTRPEMPAVDVGADSPAAGTAGVTAAGPAELADQFKDLDLQ